MIADSNKTEQEAAPTASSSNLTQSVLRPRLVAKSANGPRTSTPKAMNLNARSGKGAGPDPNQVWNRNRGQNSYKGFSEWMLIMYSLCTSGNTQTSHGRGAKTTVWDSLSVPITRRWRWQGSQMGRY